MYVIFGIMAVAYVSALVKMKKWIIIILMVVMISTLLFYLAEAQDIQPKENPEDEIPEPPTPELKNDTRLNNDAKSIGIDKDKLEVVKDYGIRAEGKSPYSREYAEKGTNKRYLVTTALPQTNADGVLIDVGFEEFHDSFIAKNNLFSLIINNTQINLLAVSDQPDGKKNNDQVNWNPQLFLGKTEYNAVNSTATLLPVDPINENYINNTLEWDYGIAIRRVRIIEGKFFERWIFNESPKDNIEIKHNFNGDFNASIGTGYDADGIPLNVQVKDDSEIVDKSEFDKAIYPVQIGASATFHPDASLENTTVDGRAVENTDADWATMKADAGDGASDDDTNLGWIIGATATPNVWAYFHRAIMLFDTSSLPDDAVITSAVLSLYGYDKSDSSGNNAPIANIYSSSPASNTVIVSGDYDSGGTLAFTDDGIPYANFSITGYNDFNFNGSGIAAISLVGVSKFMLRDSVYDVGDTVPTWVSGSNGNMKFSSYASEKGAGYLPTLVVNYTASSYVSVFYPDANLTNTSVDGRTYYISEGDTWSNIQGGAGTGAIDTAKNGEVAQITTAAGSGYYYFNRGILLFDTSSLPDNAIISAATFSIYGRSKDDSLSISPTLNVYSAAPASTTALAAGDYDSLGTTAYSDTAITYAGFSIVGYNDFDLNTDGIAAINVTGITKLGTREATYDAPNNDPEVGGTSSTSFFNAYFSEQGAGYKPKLTITYTIPLGDTTVPSGNITTIANNSVFNSTKILIGLLGNVTGTYEFVINNTLNGSYESISTGVNVTHIFNASNGTYKVHGNITDDLNSIEGTTPFMLFTIANNTHLEPVTDTCSCPIGQNWEISNGNICNITTACDINGYSFRVNANSGAYIYADVRSSGCYFDRTAKVFKEQNVELPCK